MKERATTRGRRQRGLRIGVLVSLLLILAFLVFALSPFYVMLVTSLKSLPELYNARLSPFWAFKPTFEHFRYLFTETQYLRWYGNSLFVSLTSTAISTAVSILAAYGLVRVRFPGSEATGMAVFAAYLIPTSLLFLPLTKLVNALGLTNSLWSLVITYPTFQVPFSTWLLMGYFKAIPLEIEEAAFVDGATRLGALVRIIVPTALPGIISVVIFSFTLAWGELLYALTFISDPSRITLSLGTVTALVRGDVFFWGSLMAGGLLAAVPVAFVYALLSRLYISGLTAGATK